MDKHTEYSNSASESISLKDLLLQFQYFFRYLKTKKRIITVFTLAGAALGLVYSLIVVPLYTAEVVFVLENTKEKGSDIASIASKFGLSAGGSSSGLFQDDDNIISFIKSRTIITQTLFSRADFNGKEQLLIDRYVEANDYRNQWKKEIANVQFHENPAQRTMLEDSLIGFFCKSIIENNLSVDKPDKRGDIIVATTTFADPLFAKAFIENILENVSEFYTKTVTKKAQQNVDILERQVDSIRGLLNNSLSGVAISSEANPNMNPALQRLRVPSQRKMVDVEMNKAILEELVKNLELAKVSLRRETPLIQAIDRPILPLDKKKPGKLKSILLWGIVFNLITVVILSLKYYYKKLMGG